MTREEVKEKLNKFFNENKINFEETKLDCSINLSVKIGDFVKSIYLYGNTICFISYLFKNDIMTFTNTETFPYSQIEMLWFSKNKLYIDLKNGTCLAHDM